MHKKRLLKLADLLEADAKNKKGIKFDLTTWGESRSTEKIAMNCGTAACAVGLACISGAFKKSGLDYVLMYDEIFPIFGPARGWDAVEDFFDLNPYQSEFLFSSCRYKKTEHRGAKGERTVAKRIRKFVKNPQTHPSIC